jgi:hypothetical protein
MRKQSKQEAEATIDLRLWTYAEAVKAVPYLRCIVGSLREHWLDAQRVRLQVRRLNARPGRPDRQALILRAEAGQDAELAKDRLNEVLRELEALGIHALDAAKGLALIPFRQGNDLAWFVFDLFAPRGLETWRLDADPLETRRPLRPDHRLVDKVFSSSSFDISPFRSGRR